MRAGAAGGVIGWIASDERGVQSVFAEAGSQGSPGGGDRRRRYETFGDGEGPLLGVKLVDRAANGN